MYQGGKTRIAKPIAEILFSDAAECSTYVEPFIGSAAVFSRMAPHFEHAIGADLMPDLIMMWQALTLVGWGPPEHLSEAEYRALRRAAPSPLRAFAGFPCSFGGKWFGGYANDPLSDRNYASTARRSVLRRAAEMEGADLRRCDYRDLSDEMGPGTLVYCDPPYANTLGYAGPGSFDSKAFWSVMEAWAESGARVYVSEYTAPPGWVEVWSVERHTSTALDNSGARAVDRLFTYDPMDLI